MKWFFGVSGIYCFNCGRKGHLGYDCDRPMVEVCTRDEEIAKKEVDRAEAMSLADEMDRQRDGRGRNRSRENNTQNTYRPRHSSLPSPRNFRQSSDEGVARNGSRGYSNRGYKTNNNRGYDTHRRHSGEGYNSSRRHPGRW
uniref:CCHC-type domain-containing protein n=1 Tax=Cyclophora tenuis TaxID=216820 RepID=A0A7S1D5E5_CYCTE